MVRTQQGGDDRLNPGTSFPAGTLVLVEGRPVGYNRDSIRTVQSRGIPGSGGRRSEKPVPANRIRPARQETGGPRVDPKWYLVKTKPLNENKVFARLSEAGFDSIFPRIRKKTRRKVHPEVRPLFPTYLFVRFAIEQLQTIRYTRGVARIVSFGPEPQEVGEDIISAVRQRMDEEGIVALVRPPANWKPGDRIRIGEGPFEGLEAIFLEEMPDRDRVVLLLEAVSSFRVMINKDLIER